MCLRAFRGGSNFSGPFIKPRDAAVKGNVLLYCIFRIGLKNNIIIFSINFVNIQHIQYRW